MLNVTTLTELFETNRNIRKSITYHEGENDSHDVSYGELHERALGISDEHRHKLLRVARKLGKPFIYTERRSLDRIGTFAAQAGETEVFNGLRSRAFLVDDLDDISRAGKPYEAEPHDIAFIQFSSGSTSEPKGVVLTHSNVIANCRGVSQAAKLTDDDISLSWMPLTHDMGLIGFHIIMFSRQVHAHLMPTELFVRRPLLWLTLASRIRATILCSPNFGYKHYLKVLGDRPIEGLDLSATRLIFNGAEPISVELCNEFLTRLEPAKLARNAMFPVYGLAEASLAVTFPEVGAPQRTLTLNRHRLNVGSPIEVVAKTDRDAVELISEGKVIPYCKLRLTDDEDQPVPENRIGNIQISGDNVTRGYFENPEANSASFTADGWVRTGDLGLFHDGELYVSGRAKEIIFVNGQNYYPHDLEAIAQRAGDLELGKVVAAGVRPRDAQTEQLAIFILHRGGMPEFLPVANEVTRLVNEQTGLEVAYVVPVKRIPKTTSGKIQRHLLEEAFVDGEFTAELQELAALRAADRGGTESGSLTEIEDKLKTICDTALQGKRVGVNDNLFEVGASSLKLIEIHERIDHEYPGLIDLTELFDFPTIGELARHLQSKLA